MISEVFRDISWKGLEFWIYETDSVNLGPVSTHVIG